MTDAELNEAVCEALGWEYDADAPLAHLAWSKPGINLVTPPNYLLPENLHRLIADWEATGNYWKLERVRDPHGEWCSRAVVSIGDKMQGVLGTSPNHALAQAIIKLKEINDEH